MAAWRCKHGYRKWPLSAAGGVIFHTLSELKKLNKR